MLSLYPWRFGPFHPGIWHWFGFETRGHVLDTVLNVWFYVPIGLLGYFALARSITGALLIGTLLTATVEYLQQWVPARYGNIYDLSANFAGTAAGAGLALLIESPSNARRFRVLAQSPLWRVDRPGALLLALWLAAQLFPLAPVLRMGKVAEILEQLRAFAGSWPQAIATGVGFAALVVAVRRPAWLALAFLALPAQAFILERRLYPLHVLAGATGWLAGWLVSQARCERLVGPLAILYVVVEEFRPFRLGARQQVFTWAPFSGFTSGAANPYFVSLLGKLFLFAAVLYLIQASGRSLSAAAAILALVMAAGEWLQQWVPGRTPESTDPILVLIAAALVYRSTRKPGAA